MTQFSGAGMAHKRSRRIESTSSLRFRIVIAVGAVAFLLLSSGVLLASRAVAAFVAAQADARLLDATRRSVLIIERLLVERQRQLELLGSDPVVVDAAREGSARAAALGLVGQPLAELERRFDRARSLDVSARAKRYLLTTLATLDVAEIMVTDEHGYNVVTTERTSDFVQSDEQWWQRAFAGSAALADAVYDESARQMVVSLAGRVHEPGSGGRSEGVIKVGFGLASADAALARASGGAGAGAIAVDLVDVTGNVIATSGSTTRGKPFPAFDQLDGATRDSVVSYGPRSARRRAAMLFTNNGRWRLIAHVPEGEALAQARGAQSWLFVAAGVLFILLFVGLVYISTFIERRISRPASGLAAVAEAIAGGDLSVRFHVSSADDEIGRVSRATKAMLHELRRLTAALNRSAAETAAMAREITVGSEHMAASAQQMAETSSDLSVQSTEMASTIQAMAGDAGQLVAIAAELDAGAHDGVERNARLRDLARENRQRLDDNATVLQTLAAEVRENAEAVQALAEASEEIRNFVALVQKMARQSKLLALNAAMEAARAGERGEGFAVVASEVRRLAASSTAAAERTEQLVSQVLQRVEVSRLSSARAVETVRAVVETTQATYESFGHIEQAVAEADRWTGEIERAATASNELVNHITRRLETVARGTEAFAAAMQEVAATSEQQSASTEQIAAAADKLNAAADRLATLVATFRTTGEEGADERQEPGGEATAPDPTPVRRTVPIPLAEMVEA